VTNDAIRFKLTSGLSQCKAVSNEEGCCNSADSQCCT